jgi:hypothetical protein
MKNAVLWDVAPCGSCKSRHFRGTCCLHVSNCPKLFLARVYFNPEDGGDKFLLNIGFYKTHTAPHPRRRNSSISFQYYSLWDMNPYIYFCQQQHIYLNFRLHVSACYECRSLTDFHKNKTRLYLNTYSYNAFKLYGVDRPIYI